MNRFKKYSNYQPISNYLKELDINKNEDKLLLMIDNYFQILEKETEVNIFTSIEDRIIPLESTQKYLEKLFIEIQKQQELVKEDSVEKLCWVYSVFMQNNHLRERNTLGFPIRIAQEFEQRSFGCSMSFLLLKYFKDKVIVDMNKIEKKKFESLLDAGVKLKEFFNGNKDSNLDVELWFQSKNELSQFIKGYIEKEKLDFNALVYYLLDDENCRKDISFLFGMNIFNEALKDEKNKWLFDYRFSNNFPMYLYFMEKEEPVPEVMKDIFRGLPEGLFEKKYLNYQICSEEDTSISEKLPKLFQIYRTEKLKERLIDNDVIRKRQKI